MDYYGSNLYGTTANVGAATFSNPMNPANMNSGWGIDPSLLTPSYDAPYRPQFTGTSGYTPYGNTGFFRGANNIFGLPRDPYWGNPVDNIQGSVRGFASRPFDAAAWGVQNIALPYIGYSGMAKILGPASSPQWGMFKSLWNMPRQLWRGEGVAAGFGRGLGGGIARGLGAGEGLAGFSAGMGGLMAGVAAPLAAGYAVTTAMDSTMVQPYISNRRNANLLNSNFAGVYFGQGNGNVITGKGLSYSAAEHMGSQITTMGMNDMMLGKGDYSKLLDLGARAGMFDNVNASQITKRVKDIASEVKLMVSIANDPSIQDAIETLSKLNLAGANLSGGRLGIAGKAAYQLGGFAAQAGTSIQRLMDTVGMQGQYLFQQNGMTPYLGQLAAANSYAGFSAAQRTGLLSPATLARMGGIEGAAQASLTAQVLGSQTPFAMMSAYNKFIAGKGGAAIGGKGQSVVSTVSSFGASVGGDPLSALGAIGLYGSAAAGADLTRQGSLGLQNQALSILRELGIPPAGKNGSYSAEQLMGVLTQYMNIPADTARAYVFQRSSEQNRHDYNLRRSAIQGYGAEQMRQFINQHDLGNGPIDRAVHATRLWWQRTSTAIADVTARPVSHLVGRAEDAMARVADWWGYGRTLHKGSGVLSEQEINALASGKDSSATIQQLVIPHDVMSGQYRKILSSHAEVSVGNVKSILSKINELAKGSGKAAERARAFISAGASGDKEKASKAFQAILANDADKLGGAAQHFEANNNLNLHLDTIHNNRDQLVDAAIGMHAKRVNALTNGEAAGFAKAISTAVGGAETTKSLQVQNADRLQNLQTIGAALHLSLQLATNKDEESIAAKVRTDKKYAGVLAAAGGPKATTAQIVRALADIEKRSIGQSTDTLGLKVFQSLTPEQISHMTLAQKNAEIGAAIRANGGVALDTKISGAAHMTLRERSIVVQNQVNQQNALTQAYQAYKDNGIDYSQLQGKMGNIDKTTEFSMAVDKFASTVDKQAGKKTDTKEPKFKTPYDNGNMNTQLNANAY